MKTPRELVIEAGAANDRSDYDTATSLYLEAAKQITLSEDQYDILRQCMHLQSVGELARIAGRFPNHFPAQHAYIKALAGAGHHELVILKCEALLATALPTLSSRDEFKARFSRLSSVSKAGQLSSDLLSTARVDCVRLLELANNIGDIATFAPMFVSVAVQSMNADAVDAMLSVDDFDLHVPVVRDVLRHRKAELDALERVRAKKRRTRRGT